MNAYDIFLYLSTFLIVIPMAVFCLFPVIDHLKHPLSHLLCKIGLVFVCYFIIVFIVYLVLKRDLGNALMFPAVPVFFYLYQKETDILPSASLFIMLTACCLGALSYIVYQSCGMLLYPHGHYTTNYIESILAQLIFLIVSDILLYFPARKYLGWMVSHFENIFVWRIACIFPCFFTLAAVTYVPYDYYDMYSRHAMHIYYSMTVTLLIFIILLYILFYNLTYNYVENQRILEEQKILEVQAKQYSQLSEHVQETRQLRHDFRHQIAIISELLNQKDYDSLNKYLAQYEASISSPAKIYCRQPAVNALLSHYDYLCKKDHIEANFAVDFPESFTISSVDFCMILGNLLENAYFECITLKKYKKFIQLKALQTAPGAYVLMIENPYEHEIKKNASGFLSSRHKNCIGTWLKSVTAICKKYDGHLSIQTDNHRFKVKMFLQC